MPLIPTFLFIESLISLIHLYFFQKSVTIDKYFFIVLNTTVILEILRINTTECLAKCVRNNTVQAIPTLLYGIEVSYYSLIVCAHTVVNTVVTMANIEKNII
jgi:hypothetical protein